MDVLFDWYINMDHRTHDTLPFAEVSCQARQDILRTNTNTHIIAATYRLYGD